MPNKDLIDYVKTQLENGITKENLVIQIENSSDWTRNDIEKAFEELGILNSETHKRNGLGMVIFGVILVLLLLTSLWLLYSKRGVETPLSNPVEPSASITSSSTTSNAIHSDEESSYIVASSTSQSTSTTENTDQQEELETQPEQKETKTSSAPVPDQPVPETVLPHMVFGSTSGADTGFVVLPENKTSLLEKIFPLAHAQNSQLHRIMVYLAQDPSNTTRNQIFYYDLEFGQTGQVSHETQDISRPMYILDAPVSAILYYTETSFKFVRLTDSKTITLSSKHSAAYNSFAISPNSKMLAYYNDSSKLVLRDLTTTDLDIIDEYSVPVGKGGKGIGHIAFSPDGSTIFFGKSVTATSPDISYAYGATELMSLNPITGETSSVFTDGREIRPFSFPAGSDDLYYVDYRIGGDSEPSVNKLNISTKEKISIPSEYARWKGLYLEDKVYTTSAGTGSEKNVYNVYFNFNKYDFKSMTSEEFRASFESSYMEGNPDRQIRPQFIGFGKDETEVIVATRFFLGASPETDTGTTRYYNINLNTLEISEFFSASFVLTPFGVSK